MDIVDAKAFAKRDLRTRTIATYLQDATLVLCYLTDDMLTLVRRCDARATEFAHATLHEIWWVAWVSEAYPCP